MSQNLCIRVLYFSGGLVFFVYYLPDAKLFHLQILIIFEIFQDYRLYFPFSEQLLFDFLNSLNFNLATTVTRLVWTHFDVLVSA